MGLGGKKTKEKKVEKKDNKFVTLMQVLKGDKPRDDGGDNIYVKASSYKGRLIWQAFGGENGDDEDESTFYEIKSGFVSEPHKDAPDFVMNTIAVNLNNPKAAELLKD